MRPIYTIGYSSGSMDDLVARLPSGTTHIVDVRTNAYSNYQEDFREPQMSRGFAERGLKYVYLGDRVGNKPDWPDVFVAGEVDPDRVRRHPLFQQGIKKILEAAAAGKVLCLMCGCARPHECHRGRTIGEELREAGMECIHCLPDGTSITQEQLSKQLAPKQGNLFAD